jgi:glycosyltransferase involved in cell wall biosynthesis
MDGIVFIGNPPMYPSGYGKQLSLLQKHLAGKYYMAHISDFGYHGPSFEYNGVTVYGVAEHPGVLTTKHIDKCIANFLNKHPIDKWIVVGLGNLYNRGILEGYPSILLAEVESESLTPNELHSLSTSIPVAVSQFGKRVIESHGLDCSFVTPHAVDTTLIPTKSSRSLRSTKQWPFPSTRDFVVGFFGDFSQRKSPDLAFEVWTSFANKHPDARLWIHHSNHIDMDNKTMASFMQSTGVHVTTTDEGWDDRQLLEKLKTLDCLLHPSNREGFGILQAEAQCVGTPVVSYDCGPAREVNVIPSLVSPKRDAEELLQRLEFIYTRWKNHDFSLNQEIERTAIQRFNTSTAFAELENVISYGFSEFYPPIKHSPPGKSKHICLISTWGIDCGIATYTQMLAEQLAERHTLTILSEGDEMKQFQHSPKINVIQCWNRNYPSSGSLVGVLDALKPDIIHVQHETSLFKMQHSMLNDLYGMNAKLVTTLHTPDFANSDVLQFASQSDLVIVHNKPLAEKMNGSLPNAVQHIPHGVKAIQSGYNRTDTGVPSSIPLFFNFGYCSQSKGVWELIRAVKLLKNSGLLDANGDPLTTTHFELIIYAGKSNKDYFERCAKEAAGVDGITLSDEILPEEGIDFWASQCDFAIFPYTSVSHPYRINSTSGATMRVIGAGKPIIATDEGRLRDIVGGVHGWKPTMGSVEDLALAIRSAVNQFNFKKKEYAAMSENVLDMAKRYSWPVVSNAHSECYKALAQLHHYRTKTPVLNPRGRNLEPKMILDIGGEEE